MTVVLAASALALLAFIWVNHVMLVRAVGRPPRPIPARLPSYPSLSVIRPVKGLDAGAEENVRAALENGYPGEVETLFVFDDESEPVLPIVRRAIRQHEARGGRGLARVVLCGSPPPGRTGKLNAMVAGLEVAGGELVAFADSDIRPGPEALRLLVETLVASPEAGAAFASVVVRGEVRTTSDLGYALLVNGIYGPEAAASTQRNGGELPFIMGQLMVLRREAIEAIGGLESAEGQFVDDMYLGARIKAAGYRNLVAPLTVPIVQHGLSLGEFARVYHRWIAFSRSGLPGRAFKVGAWLRVGSFWVGLLASGISAAEGLWLAALLFAAVPASVSSSVGRLHEGLGGAPVDWARSWVAFAVLLAAPFVFVAVLGQREVEWRGRVYQLDGESRLSEPRGEPVDSAEPAA